MECMCAQTRPQFILSSERVVGNGVRTHVISKGKITSSGGIEEGRIRDAASRRTASPTHYRLSFFFLFLFKLIYTRTFSYSFLFKLGTMRDNTELYSLDDLDLYSRSWLYEKAPPALISRQNYKLIWLKFSISLA